MNHCQPAARLRSIVLVLLAAGVLMLGIAGTAGAAPASVPGAQTLPTATPAPSNPRPCVSGTPSTAPVIGQPVRIGSNPQNGDPTANCPWSLDFPPEVFADGRTIEMTLVDPNSAPPPNPGDVLLGFLIDIKLFDRNGNLVPNPTFSTPFTLCYAYTSNDLALVGNDPTRMVFQFYDITLARWVAIPTTLDPAGGQVCGQVGHLTLFAVAGKAGVRTAPPVAGPVQPGARPVSLPNTATPEAPLIAPWFWALLVLVLGAGVALRLQQARRATPQPAAVVVDQPRVDQA